MTNDYNVARVPTNLSAQTGAAIGVAFVSAVLALGICLGINFAETIKTPYGPNLSQILKQVGRDKIPEDVRIECFDNIPSEERPQQGDWVAIWGGMS